MIPPVNDHFIRPSPGTDSTYGMCSAPPVRPDDSECCGSGCNPCIFDVYEEQLKKWKMKQDCDRVSTALSESKFLPFLITDVDMLTPSVRLFKFSPVKLTDGTESGPLISKAQSGVDYEIIEENLGLTAGYYLILKGEYEEHDGENVSTTRNISRAYTPVLDGGEKKSFKIIVSLYPNGKMSQFLSNLKREDIVFWRGPYKEYVYTTNSYKRIIFIGGGTGVIPLYNLAREIVENDNEETLINFVAAFKTVDSMILRKELNGLQDYWNFTLCYHISSVEDACTLKYNEKVIHSRLTPALAKEQLLCYTKTECLILICGPESFNHSIHNAALEYGVIEDDIHVFK